MNEDLRFPIGEFDLEKTLAESDRPTRIDTITSLPGKIKEAVMGLENEQLDQPYRPEGWTVRQVVHHIADSHLNSYCRFKLALTEDVPDVRVYDEKLWAELPDSTGAIGASLSIIEGLHARWGALLRSMSGEDFKRKLRHPESGFWDLDGMLALYSWHSIHHTAHITNLRERMNW